MPRIRLNEAKIKSLSTSKPQEDFFHKLTPNAGLRLSKVGAKTWFVLFRDPEGRQRRHLVGEHPSGRRWQERYLTLKEFESEYEILRGDLRRGIGPVLSLSARSVSPPPKENAPTRPSPGWMKSSSFYSEGSFADLSVRFFEWCSQKRHLAPRTLEKYRIITNAHLLPTIGSIWIPALSREHLRPAIEKKNDPTVEDIRKAFNCQFNWGIDNLDFMKGLLNPFPRTKLSVGHDERWFRDDDLKAIFPAFDLLEDRSAAEVYEIMMLTGCRTDEAVGLEAEDLLSMNGERAWLIPQHKSKTGRPFTVPLTGRVGEILEPRCTNIGGSGFLFWPLVKRSKYLARLTKANKLMRRLTGIPDFEPYVFRHTLRTNLTALRVPHDVAEACLNHAKQGMTRNYNHWEYWQEKKEALARWHAKLESLKTVPSANVITLDSKLPELET